MTGKRCIEKSIIEVYIPCSASIVRHHYIDCLYYLRPFKVCMCYDENDKFYIFLYLYAFILLPKYVVCCMSCNLNT